MKDPQQELFTTVRLALTEKFGSGNVYDYLPGKEAAYPFIYMGWVQQVDDRGNKSLVLANIFMTITVWHSSAKQRGAVSQMLLDIKKILGGITHTDTFAWRLINVNQRIDTDAQTKTLRGNLNAEYKLMGGTET